MELGKDFITAFGLMGVPLMTVVGVLAFILVRMLPANIEGRQKDLNAFIGSMKELQDCHEKERIRREEICLAERASDKATFLESLHTMQLTWATSQDKTERRRDKEMDAIITRLEQVDQHLEGMGMEFEGLRSDFRIRSELRPPA